MRSPSRKIDGSVAAADPARDGARARRPRPAPAPRPRPARRALRSRRRRPGHRRRDDRGRPDVERLADQVGRVARQPLRHGSSPAARRCRATRRRPSRRSRASRSARGTSRPRRRSASTPASGAASGATNAHSRRSVESPPSPAGKLIAADVGSSVAARTVDARVGDRPTGGRRTAPGAGGGLGVADGAVAVGVHRAGAPGTSGSRPCRSRRRGGPPSGATVMPA